MSNEISFKIYDLEIVNYINSKGEKKRKLQIKWARAYDENFLEEMKELGVKEYSYQEEGDEVPNL